MSKIFQTSLLSLALLSLLACGQKGPLILPDESTQESLTVQQ